MKLIIKERGSGKSTQLVYTSATTGYRILTNSVNAVLNLKHLAEKCGVHIPQPMTITEYLVRRHGLHNKEDEGLLIDNTELVLEDILNAFFETPVKAITLSTDERSI